MSTLEINLAVEFNLPAGHRLAATAVGIEFTDGELTTSLDGYEFYRAVGVDSIRTIAGEEVTLDELHGLSQWAKQPITTYVRALCADINEEAV